MLKPILTSATFAGVLALSSVTPTMAQGYGVHQEDRISTPVGRCGRMARVHLPYADASMELGREPGCATLMAVLAILGI
jgi:hypothetical protein